MKKKGEKGQVYLRLYKTDTLRLGARPNVVKHVAETIHFGIL